MNETLTLLNASIFFVLALIHLYWLVGGRWAMDAAVPTNRNGRKVFHPGPFPTLIVAIGLLGFALVNLLLGGYVDMLVSVRLFRYLLLAIALVFLLRVVGDFRYIGLFKSYGDSIFAKYDNRIYIPLSFFFALSHGLLLI